MTKTPPKPRKKPLTEREREKISEAFHIKHTGKKLTAYHKDSFTLELTCKQKPKQSRPTDTPSDANDLRYHMDGYAVMKDCRFTVHIYETPKKKYPAEGKVAPTAPNGSKTLQKRGSERRKVMAKSTTTDDERQRIANQEHCSKLNIYRVFSVCDITDKVTIVTTIHDKADEMYKENLSTIASLLQGHTDFVLHPFTMYELNIKQFINSRPGSVTSRTQTNWMRDIKKIFLELNEYPVSEIPDLAIRSLRGKLGKRPDEKLRLAESFFSFCQEQGAYQGENPFTRFWSHHITDKSSPDGVTRAHLGRIDLKNESVLNARIEENCRTEPKWLALLLAKEGHFNVEKISQLQWKHLIFEDQMVVVNDHHPNCTCSLKNFSRPILPFGARLLTQLHNELLTRADENAVAEMYVVSQPDDPYAPVVSSKITRFIRESLYAAGVTADVMQQAAAHSKGSEGGAGVLLLHKNYDDVLSTICGIPDGSGIFNFLCGNVPTDTLTQYYRSLVDPSARDTLNTLLRRDGRFNDICSDTDDESDEITIVETPNAETENEDIKTPALQEFTVNPVSVNHLTGVVGDIYLPAGSSITFSVPHGMEGDFKARKIVDGKEIRSKHIPQLNY